MRNFKILGCFVLFVVIEVAECYAQIQNEYSNNIDSAQLVFEKKEYIKAAEYYSKAFISNNNLGRVDHRYSAARCWALAGEVDSAFYQLHKILRVGYAEYLEILTDVALINLKSDDRWNKVLDSVKVNLSNRNERERRLIKNLNKPLVAMLDTIYLDDQLYRRQINGIEQRYGRLSSEARMHYELIAKKDTINTIKVKRILDKYGWLGKEEIGETGNDALFLVIQHSDLNTQLHYLPLIREAVKNGKVRASSLALLEDRVALRQGKPQIYGSQVAFNNGTGKYYVSWLDDPENVDKRRSSVGLTPIADYVKRWEIIWSVEQYKKDLVEKKLPNKHSLKPIPKRFLPVFKAD